MDETLCCIAGCTARVKNHRWGHIKAEGWFFTKAGKAYCPRHVPDWVEGWRKNGR